MDETFKKLLMVLVVLVVVVYVVSSITGGNAIYADKGLGANWLYP